MVKASFAPLGPPLLPWENCMEMGQQSPGQTLQLLDQVGPVGQFGEIRKTMSKL